MQHPQQTDQPLQNEQVEFLRSTVDRSVSDEDNDDGDIDNDSIEQAEHLDPQIQLDPDDQEVIIEDENGDEVFCFSESQWKEITCRPVRDMVRRNGTSPDPTIPVTKHTYVT